MCYAFSGPKSEREEAVEVRNGARPHTRESELYPTRLEKPSSFILEGGDE